MVSWSLDNFICLIRKGDAQSAWHKSAAQSRYSTMDESADRIGDLPIDTDGPKSLHQ